jgi:hypothetical protein
VATRHTPGTRAKDSDRTDTCQVLDTALADVTSTYLIFDPSADPTTPGALALSVYVSSDYGSGYIELDGAGNVKQINYPS